MPDPTPTPSGWFPDPLDRYDHRYFNGTLWTSDVSTDGQRFVDPLGIGPGSARGGAANKAAAVAVVTGSVGLAIAWIPFVVVIGGVLSVLALVFGTKGVRQARTSGVGRRASIAGLVMGGLGIAGSVVGVILSIGVFREVIRFIEPGDVSTDVTACSVDGRDATVSGTVTNLDGEPRRYTLFIEVGGRSEFVEIAELAPDETAGWSTVVRMNGARTECNPDIVVQGPFPYGIETDPVN